MSQNSPIQVGTQSSKISGLNPKLATALASLEVHLDKELVRYRRTRNELQKLNDVIFPENRGGDNSNTEEQNYLQVPPTPKSSKRQTPPPPPNPVTSFAERTKSRSSIVPTTIQTAGSENILPTDSNNKEPDDYLESSEALRRSLTEEQTEVNKSDNFKDSLLSPLGIASLLLMFVATLSLGYVVFSAKTVPQFDSSKSSNNISSPTAENTEVLESNAQAPTPEITAIPKYPNLAAREFPEVKNPNDVVGLKPKVQPTPTALPTSLIIPPPISPAPPINSAPTTTEKPLSKAVSSLSPQKKEIKPSTDRLYYIVADNQSNGALSAAQLVVPDAYLSNNKKFIYLGALKTKEEAEQRLQQLESKGIKARLRQ